MPVDEERQRREIIAYIQKWDRHLDTHFGAPFPVEGKSLLVVGSGWGTEILWALKRGAARVVGVDPRSDDRTYVEAGLAEHGLSDLADRFVLHKGMATTLPDMDAVDLIFSNNVFEHVDGLSANLATLARFLPDKGGRIRIFADPLFYSSLGHHMRVGAWEHLTQTQESLQARVPRSQWRDYRTGLNGMTLTSFLGAVCEAGLILLDLGISPDLNMNLFPEMRDALPPGIKPMDLCLSGISCTLAFPENL